MDAFTNSRPADWLREMADEYVAHDATPCECAGYTVELRDIQQLVLDNEAQAKAMERLQEEKDELRRIAAEARLQLVQLISSVRKILDSTP